MNVRSRSAKTTRFAATAIAVAALAACQPASQRDAAIATQATHDGLVRAASGALDQLYLKPGTTLQGYDQVLIEPVDIAFRADWKPERNSALYRVAPPDRERIRADLAENFQETFREELEEGGYRLAEEAGRNTLGVRPRIVDLYINAPDTMNYPGRVTQYTRDTGSMTLVAELYDSVTGEVLARTVDKDRGMEQDWLQRTDAVWNNAEAKRTFRRWAAALRQALDRARAAQAPEARDGR